MTARSLASVLRALVEKRVDFIVFGAIGLMAHGLVRATQDLDIFIRPEKQNIVRLREALKSVYPDDSAINEVTYEDLAGEYPAIRYNAPDGFGIDIISRLGNAWTYDQVEYELKELEGVSIPVATPAVLYRMKKDTLRWKDKFDAEALRERFGLEE